MRPRTLALVGAIVASATIARSAVGAGDRARPHATPEAYCAITLDGDGSLSAAIVDTPLDEVLAQLSRQIGARIVWIAPRSAIRTTVWFRGVPVTEAIARLLPDHNYVLVFGRDGTGRARLERLRVSSIGAAAPTLTADILPSAAAPTTPHLGGDARGPGARTPRSDGEARVRLEAVRGLVEYERSAAEESPLGETLARVLAGNDEADVERATMLGLAALATGTLEAVARTDDTLRPPAIDLLATRAELEPPALAALDRLANDADDPALGQVATQVRGDLEAAPHR